METLYYIAEIINTSGLPTTKANSGTLNTVLGIVFAFAASIALLMIVISGFRYIVAHGDPNATAQARNGLQYALIGLIIVIAAYSIVTFVIKGI